jgi:multimeric flavodoxin WrbA
MLISCKELREMKIEVLMGSPNKNGSTRILVDSFVHGAESAGHTCEVIDVCRANVHPCIGCVRCGYEGPCVQKDDVEAIRRSLLESYMVVFATPLYYYGITAQLKTVIDRFCAYNSSLNGRHLKSALLTVAWNADDWTFEALESHYKTLVRYINFEDNEVLVKRMESLFGVHTLEHAEEIGQVRSFHKQI